MKSNDIIRPFEHSLFVQFGTSGELQSASTLRLDAGVTLTRDGKEIRGQYHASPSSFLIDRFFSEQLAGAAYQELQRKVRRYARHRRIAAFGRNSIVWGAAPLLALMLVMALNLSITRGLGPGYAAPAISAADMRPPPPDPQPPRTIAPPLPGKGELARAMADGVKAGKFSFQISQGRKGILYVFSDPSCPHCRELEPELAKLSRDFTIHVFPVSVFGGKASSLRLDKLLCAKANERAPIWKTVVAADDPKGDGCAAGAAAVAANDQIFRSMRFPGTPTILNAAGEATPDDLPNTADAIGRWMRRAAPGG